MDFLKPYDFKQLKAFFLALKQSRFNLKQIPSFVIMDGVRTPVDKTHCLNLLRSFPDLSGEQFKNDNLLIKYLSQSGNLNRILGKLTQEQQIEITKVLEEKPVAAEAGGEQVVGGETSVKQQVPSGEPAETMGGVAGFPTGASTAARRPARIIYNVPKTAAEEVSKEKAVKFQIPKVSAGFVNTIKNFSSQAARLFQRNIGKFFTVGRIGTAVSAGIGAVAGAGFGPIGSLAGAAGGGIGSFWIRSGDGARFLGKAANGGLNAFERLSRPGLRGASGSFGSFGSKKLVWGLFLGLFFFVFFSGIIGGLSGTTPAGQAAPQASPAGSPVPYQPGAGSGILSCPLNGAVTITNGSLDTGGHCSPDYEKAYGVCTKPGSAGYTGKDTAIDITSPDRFVYLPRIQGANQVKWTVDEAGNVPITEGEGGGISVAAKTTAGGKTYHIRFVHIESTSLKIGDTVDPGTLVGQYYLNNPYGAHVHITLQEDGAFKPVDSYFNLCK